MSPSSNKDSIIRLFHVYKRYKRKNAICDITLDIAKNDFCFITGPSGAGKTTLLKLLYLGEKASEGQILIDGINLLRISKKNNYNLRRRIGVIFQDYKLIPTKTIFENVALVLEVAGQKKAIITKKVKSVLRNVGMEERMDSYPLTLSGGEQQRVAIARAIVGNPKIILADEPTGNLDAKSSKTVISLLKGLHTVGTTLIIATHDSRIIQSFNARTIYLKDGYLQTQRSL